MKSKKSNISDIKWESSLGSLFSRAPDVKHVKKLNVVNIKSLLDLLWIVPLRISQTPPLLSFNEARDGQYFYGSGIIKGIKVRPAFKRYSKKVLLYHTEVLIVDDLSQKSMTLKWFNIYPTQKKKIESCQRIYFLGLITIDKKSSSPEVHQPQIWSFEDQKGPPQLDQYIVEYPTMNKVSGNQLKKMITQIPSSLWNHIPQVISQNDIQIDHQKTSLTLSKAFQIIHGKVDPQEFDSHIYDLAKKRLIYEEFLIDQLKAKTRKKFHKQKPAPVFNLSSENISKVMEFLPFVLTSEQKKVLKEICSDLVSGHPMTRMLQGDVGCGKTIVSFIILSLCVRNQLQAALMCPTETLARQHYQSFKDLDPKLNVELLTGALKSREKKKLLEKMKSENDLLVIGTHALYQKNVEFKKLSLVVIDEQHKFGVDQRLNLTQKGEGVHCLMMTATPIPRSLGLTQYGELDFSTIKSMPAGRKMIKTRIVEPVHYVKYLEFVKLRISMGDQAYFVFPAIEENPETEIKNIQEGFEKYQRLFPTINISFIHGQMSAEDKNKIMEDFYHNNIQILFSTSVVEVGINLPNATIMSIYGPDRFGLSSLHQLRGRIGRGNKPGFCFLVLDEKISQDSLERLKVIESSNDGFKIAEQDLKLRGEGDLFGIDQSGKDKTRKLGNIIHHQSILEKVCNDLRELESRNPEILLPVYQDLAKNHIIRDTI